MTSSIEAPRKPRRLGCLRLISGVAVGALAAAGIYHFLVRPWHTRWGATDAEVMQTLPGDELVPQPKLRDTHAITINAPAGEVWSWLAQIGQEHGGLYSYDALENLVGCDIHSADRIHPEWQNIAVGDRVRMGPDGYPVFRVHTVEPGRALVLISADNTTQEPTLIPDSADEPYMIFVWSFVLEPIDGQATRLIVRSQSDTNMGRGMDAANYVIEAVQFFMEQKMMRGIRQRAEGQPVTWW